MKLSEMLLAALIIMYICPVCKDPCLQKLLRPTSDWQAKELDNN